MAPSLPALLLKKTAPLGKTPDHSDAIPREAAFLIPFYRSIR